MKWLLPGRIARNTPIGSMCNTFSRLRRWNRSKYPDEPQTRQLSTATTKMKYKLNLKTHKYRKKNITNNSRKNVFILPVAMWKISKNRQKDRISFSLWDFFSSLCDLVSFNYTLYNAEMLSFSLFFRHLLWKSADK